MNRIRVGCTITILLGAIYAAAGLFDTLTHFAIGVCVASAGVIGYGLADYLDYHRTERMRQLRAQVWHRRDIEAREAAAREHNRVRNVYEFPRDGVH